MAPEEDSRPFVVPCADLAPGAPLRWLALGWRDLWRSPGPSLLHGLLGTHLAVDRRRAQAVRRFIGVNHAEASDPAEIAQGLGQGFGGDAETELRAVLLTDLSGLGDTLRQQCQRRHGQH